VVSRDQGDRRAPGKERSGKPLRERRGRRVKIKGKTAMSTIEHKKVGGGKRSLSKKGPLRTRLAAEKNPNGGQERPGQATP